MSAVSIELDQNPKVYARLESSPEYRALTDSQKVWVLYFLTTGSALQATKAGYQTTSEKNARVLSYELAKNSRIVAALDVAAGRTPPAPELKINHETKIESERRRLTKRLITMVRIQLEAAVPGSVAAEGFSKQLERLEIGLRLGRHTVEERAALAELKADQETPAGPLAREVPADALEVWSDPVTGVAIGYRNASGTPVKF